MLLLNSHLFYKPCQWCNPLLFYLVEWWFQSTQYLYLPPKITAQVRCLRFSSPDFLSQMNKYLDQGVSAALKTTIPLTHDHKWTYQWNETVWRLCKIFFKKFGSDCMIILYNDRKKKLNFRFRSLIFFAHKSKWLKQPCIKPKYMIILLNHQ